MNTKKLTTALGVITMAAVILVATQSLTMAAGTIGTLPVNIKTVQRALMALGQGLDDLDGHLDTEKDILIALRKRLEVTKDASTVAADLKDSKERVAKADDAVIAFGKTANRIEGMIAELFEIAQNTGDIKLSIEVAAAAQKLDKLRLHIDAAGTAVEKLEELIADIEGMIEEMPAVSPAA